MCQYPKKQCDPFLPLPNTPWVNFAARSLSENSVVGPRASGFSPDKDGEAGDVCFIVDTAGCQQAENKPLEARSSSPTGS